MAMVYPYYPSYLRAYQYGVYAMVLTAHVLQFLPLVMAGIQLFNTARSIFEKKPKKKSKKH